MVNNSRVLQFRNDRYGSYTLIVGPCGERFWRFRNGLFTESKSIDYPYEQFESMIDLIEYIHELAMEQDWKIELPMPPVKVKHILLKSWHTFMEKFQ